MQPHQQRVVEEKAELDNKIQKLNAFFHSSIFSSLPEAEKDRMKRQVGVMEEYSSILQERINAFLL
jgi:hypothetical protein